MGVKIYKPTTPGRRNASGDDFSDITKSKPEKSLTRPLKKTGGRNNQGKITVGQRGGGHKRRYRVIDFKREIFDVEAEVLAIEYDPNRTCRIALIQYTDGKKSYILAADKMKVGDKIVSSKKKVEVKPGNRMPLKYIPAGLTIYNIDGKMIRSAGTGATIMSEESGLTQIKLPSTEIRNFSSDILATIGQLSNPEKRHIRLGKAGRSRWLGRKPKVRGKAKNPVDHPHGGGEGNQSIGMKHPKTPQGKPALGVKTRKANKYSDKLIVKRRKKKRRK